VVIYWSAELPSL